MSGKRALRFSSEAEMPASMRALYQAQLAPAADTAVASPGRRGGRTAMAMLARVEVLTTDVAATGALRDVKMNKTEAAYAQHLEGRRIAGDVAWYAFEAMKLRLAEKTFYTPDFAVLLTTGALECHEVKGGYWEDDARVKIKVAARLFPWPFRAAQRRKGEWRMESF